MHGFYTILWIPLIFFIGLTCAGCSRGLIYTNVTVPLVTNMDKTPRGTRLVTIDTRGMKEPVTGIGINAQWNSRAIGDAAKQFGLRRSYYADMNTFSILGGIWQKQTVRVWGE